jgi:hypothetical protein
MEHLVWSGLESAEKDEALRAWCDEHNRTVLVPLFWVLAATGLGMAIAALEGSLPWRALFPASVLPIGVAAIVLLRRRSRLGDSGLVSTQMDRLAKGFWRYFRIFALLYPIVATLLLVSTFWGESLSPLIFMMPFVILPLRLGAADRWLVHLGFIVVGVGDLWSVGELSGGGVVGILVLNGILLGLGLLLSRRSRRRFLGAWRRARERHREERRMRQELEYAREVQLSMLPQEAPALPWLEMARLSLPATEVGGDYYDFFAIDEDRMLVVIGDVAGHGLASGIVLASIRSGLTLLVDEIENSPGVMERLNRMLRETSRTRVLVSLGLLLFDRRGHVTVTSAGHPPALLWRSRTHEVETIDLPSLPLGTGLASQPTPRVVDLDAGDALLLYTDGLFEAHDTSEEPFGLDRLIAVFAASAEEPLEDLKAEILRRVWDHRGAAPQEDDITLVAIRFDPGDGFPG